MSITPLYSTICHRACLTLSGSRSASFLEKVSSRVVLTEGIDYSRFQRTFILNYVHSLSYFHYFVNYYFFYSFLYSFWCVSIYVYRSFPNDTKGILRSIQNKTQKMLTMPCNAFFVSHSIQNTDKRINLIHTHQNRSNFRRYRVSPHANFKTYGFSIAKIETCQNHQKSLIARKITSPSSKSSKIADRAQNHRIKSSSRKITKSLRFQRCQSEKAVEFGTG